mmetsp:Transcript_61810/g.171314  ORF Transcript_61810/g.171314 Transcript_61810/m.171314 type:complete len:688 (-) Transcript_61810:103-2166(-)
MKVCYAGLALCFLRAALSVQDEALALDDACASLGQTGEECSLHALQRRTQPGTKALQGAAAKKPHIVLVLADDYGWANVGFHRRGPAGTPEEKQAKAEVHTPIIDALADAGIVLERHYAYKMCSPSRSALISGRLPVHVNTVNMPTTFYNKDDPVSGSGGIPRNMTGLAEKMRLGGYRTHMVGKWDVGMATPEHTPAGRGFETFLGYYGHANDYYRKSNILTATGELDNCLSKFVDFSINNVTFRGGVRDAVSLSHACQASEEAHPACYEEHVFKEHALATVRSHDVSQPLFLYYSFHLVHTPLQVPKSYLAKIDQLVKEAGGSLISTTNRRLYAAMTHYMDTAVGELVAALKEKDMWKDTLLLFSADNGGPIYQPGAANNYPLKGGKYNDFEGGIRTNAFVSGGFVPQEKRGQKFRGVISIADWYATFAELAGVDPEDGKVAAANEFLRGEGLPELHAIDSVAQWGNIISGTNGRTQPLHLSQDAVLHWPYKLITGKQPYARWQGVLYPNCSSVAVTDMKGGPLFTAFDVFHQQVPVTSTEAELEKVRWTEHCTGGCLFDVEADPTEHNDLAKDPKFAQKLAEMQATLAELNKALFAPDRGEGQLKACITAINNGGYYGPFEHAEDWWSKPPERSPEIQQQDAKLKALLTKTAKEIAADVKLAASKYFGDIQAVFNGKWDQCLGGP